MTAPAFEREQPVRFAHCDPAGLVLLGRGDEATGPRATFAQVPVCTSLATHRPPAFSDDLRATYPAQDPHP